MVKIPKEYPVKDERIYYISDKEITRKMVSYGWGWKSKYIGGYCFPRTKEIFIRESRRGDVKLLNHERGHLRGYKHTWLPTLMASSWVYRWFNQYFPPWGKPE